MNRSTAAATFAVLLAAFGILSTPAASAAEDPPRTDPRILEMLEAIPGGVAVSATYAVWPELGMDMIVPSSSAVGSVAARSVVSCPTGRVCAFGATGASSANGMLSWTSCNTSFPVGTFTVRSIADARSTGYAQARSRTATLATAYAGEWKNVYGTTYRVSCYT